MKPSDDQAQALSKSLQSISLSQETSQVAAPTSLSRKRKLADVLAGGEKQLDAELTMAAKIHSKSTKTKKSRVLMRNDDFAITTKAGKVI